MAGLGLDFFGNLLSGGDIGSGLIKDISGGDPTKIFGSKPDVAEFTPVDLGDETTKAIAANLENLPDISALLDKIIPNFSDLVSAGTSNALALTQGKLPQADIEALQRRSAQQAQVGGYGGTPMAIAGSLRDLGIGVLQGQEAGANMAQNWSNLAEAAYSPFTRSGGQQAGQTAANNAGIQAMKQFEFNVAAAPTPASLGHFLLDKSIGDQFMSFGLGAAGGAIAGGGGAALGGAGGGQPAGQGVYNQTYQPFDWRQSASGSSSGSNYYVNPTWGYGGGG